MKLYLILDAALSAGAMTAQACHTLRAFVGDHPRTDAHWFTHNNNIAVLEAPAPGTIADRMEAAGYKVSRFFEPDLDNALTGVAIEPHDGRTLSHLPLAGQRERRLLRSAVA